MEQGQKRLISHGPGETFALGVQMGKEAVPGQIFCLEGDLGVGKTVFTQGFARGLGIEQTVNSPTFTIFRYTRKGGFPSIILMCTASGISKRWRRLAMRTAFSAKVSAWWNGRD